MGKKVKHAFKNLILILKAYFFTLLLDIFLTVAEISTYMKAIRLFITYMPTARFSKFEYSTISA